MSFKTDLNSPAVLSLLAKGITCELRGELEEALVQPLLEEYEKKIREVVKPIVGKIAVDRIETIRNMNEFVENYRVLVAYDKDDDVPGEMETFRKE